MGHGIGFICNDCKKEEEYTLGIGMMDYSLESFFNGENKRDYNKIKKMIDKLENNKEKYSISYSREAHLCNECGFIKIMKAICIETKDWNYNYKYSCPKCKGQMRKIEIEDEIKLGNIKCQSCKSYNIELSDFNILWD